MFDKDGNVKELLCTYVPESKSGSDTSGLKVKGVVQWVDANNYSKVTLRRFKPLLGVNNGEADYINRVDKDSLRLESALVEKALDGAQIEDKFQFMRIGYFVKDKLSTKDNAVFNEIVGLKDSFNKTNC